VYIAVEEFTAWLYMMKFESTANFRLLMANFIISNATFISRYLSPTGSYPEIINDEQIPMPIIPKIYRYNVFL
jgi:hypothetical protein